MASTVVGGTFAAAPVIDEAIPPITSRADPGRPLSIGICAPYDLARPGGVNSHIRAQARALRRLGHTVCVFGASSAPLDDGEVSLGGCVSLVIGGTETGLGIDPRSWRRVARLFETARFDVLHLHEPLMPLAAWCAAWRAPMPIAATFHSHREEGHRLYPRCRPLLAPLMRRVRARIAVSDAARRTVARHFPGDYHVVPNGIDVDRFRQPTRRPAEMPADAGHVLYVGRLEPRKGVDRLIRAMTVVRSRVRHARVTIVGDGPDRRSLAALAAGASVDVTFSGRVPDDLLPAYYRAADVVCAPALGGESFGIVLLEAMAAERAIVATRIDGYTELVGDAGCARLVDAGDVPGLADEIVSLLDRPDLRQRLGACAGTVARRYDWSVVARRLESIYRDLVDG